MKRSKTAVPSSVDAAKVVIEESILTRWRNWRTWLQLNLERLKLREEMEKADAGFDLDEAPHQARLKEIEKQIAAIPSEERGEFQIAYENKRSAIADDDQRSGSLPKDATEIDRAALNQLLELCNGDPAADKLGLVPYKGQWFKLDTRALNNVPTAAQYAVGGAAQHGRIDIKGALFVGGLLLLFGVYLWAQYGPRGAKAPEVVAAPPVMLNATPVASWRPITLVVQGGDARLPIQKVAPSLWPSADEGMAGWREGSTWPLELCVAREALPDTGAQLQITSEGGALLRTYQLAAATGELSAPTSLTIRACDDEHEVRYGALASSVPPPSAAPGEAQALTASPRLTVLDVAAVGPGQDTNIPAGKVRISLQVSSDRLVKDWGALQPRLQLATGAALELITKPVAEANGRTVLNYLAEPYAVPMAAAWEVSDLSTGETMRWRLTLPTPASRLVYLAKYLHVETPQASMPEVGMLHLEIPLTTTAPDGIILRYEDIAVRQGDAVIAVPIFTQEDGTVSPGHTTTLALDLLPPEPGQEVTLTIGRQVFAIQLPEER